MSTLNYSDYEITMKSISIRFPDDLHEVIKEISQRENRSFNKQVLTMLQEALGQRHPEQQSPTYPESEERLMS